MIAMRVWFVNVCWKLINGALVLAKERKYCTLYQTKAKACKDQINTIGNDIIMDLWHERLGHMSEKGL